MDATKEGLRYIESKAIMQKYNIKKYSDNKEDSKDKKDDKDSDVDQ